MRVKKNTDEKITVIVESPAKAKTINKILGSNYHVIASYGHIRALPSRTGSVEPDANFKMHYEIIDKAKKNVQNIIDACKNASTILLATDPDREGESISWHIAEILKSKKILTNQKIARIAFNEITKGAIIKAVENPRDIDMSLVHAQESRTAIDYLVGYNLSPILWRKLPGSRSAGRVQSVALRFICEREEEIDKFQSEEYWDIKLKLLNDTQDTITATLTHIEEQKLDKFYFTNEKDTKHCADILSNLKYRVFQIEKKQQKRNPGSPFNTSLLQQEASKKLGFSAKKTMQIAQKLYEGVSISGDMTGLITYMRTDGVQISDEGIRDIRKYIEKNYEGEYLPQKMNIYVTKTKNAQEAHEAIRPSYVDYTPAKMSSYLDADMLALYSLIWNRTVASQMTPAIFDVVVVIVKDEEEEYTLKSSGSTLRFPGFLTIYQDKNDDEEVYLPSVKQGEKLKTLETIPAQHFTEPAPRFTEASLVKKLEEMGIGRPSTYANIISVLQDRDYVVFDKKRFVPEQRGRIVTEFLRQFFKKYIEYDFTADLENKLDLVSNDKLEYKSLLSDFWQEFAKNIDHVTTIPATEIHKVIEEYLSLYLSKDAGKNEACPSCEDGTLKVKLSKFGAFLGCSNYPECKYIRNIDSNTANSDDETGSSNSEFPRVIGEHPTLGKIMLCYGRYGYYLEAEQKDSKGKNFRSTIPPKYDVNNLDFSIAVNLLSLPRIVGVHPVTQNNISANIGRFGPYIEHQKTFYSLNKQYDIFSITLQDALDIIANSAKKKQEDGKEFTIDGVEYKLYNGKFGPYIKYKKKNISIPAKYEDIDSDLIANEIKKIEKKGKNGKK